MQNGDYNGRNRKTRGFGSPQSTSETLSDRLNYNLSDPTNQNYDGPINLPRLTDSLYMAPDARQSVLFAASSLASISRLLPLACEMARWERNFVHFIVLSRESLPLSLIQEVNGIYPKACPIYMHDGRPEYSEHSTNERAQSASRYAIDKTLYRVQAEAVIVDDFESENLFFAGAVTEASLENLKTMIQIPKGDIRRFFWMSRLESESLSAWDKPSIDIVVPVQSGASGSLSRLLTSLKAADYTGLRTPRLILDLPAKVDASMREVLDKLIWPPNSKDTPDVNYQLILRHRVSRQPDKVAEPSIDLLESFWPTPERNEHVLLLSSKAELSPLFYQYLHYTMLAYQHSHSSSGWGRSVLGISLETPSAYPNGTMPFVFPKVGSMPTSSRYAYHGGGRDEDTPFLWDSPSMNTLIFADRWKELHSFVNACMVKERSKNYSKTIPSQDVAGQPSWMKYLFSLMQARGYTVFHPAVYAHRKLAVRGDEKIGVLQAPLSGRSDGLLSFSSPYNSIGDDDRELATDQQFLHDILALNGDLPEISRLPIMSREGNILSRSKAKKLANDYAESFRRGVGGCIATVLTNDDVNIDEKDYEDDEDHVDGDGRDSPDSFTASASASTSTSVSALVDTDGDVTASLLEESEREEEVMKRMKRNKKNEDMKRVPDSALDLFCFGHDADFSNDDNDNDDYYFTEDDLY